MGKFGLEDLIFGSITLMFAATAIALYKNPYVLQGDRDYVVNRVKQISDKNHDGMVSAEEWKDIYEEIGITFNIEDDESKLTTRQLALYLDGKEKHSPL